MYKCIDNDFELWIFKGEFELARYSETVILNTEFSNNMNTHKNIIKLYRIFLLFIVQLILTSCIGENEHNKDNWRKKLLSGRPTLKVKRTPVSGLRAYMTDSTITIDTLNGILIRLQYNEYHHFYVREENFSFNAKKTVANEILHPQTGRSMLLSEQTGIEMYLVDNNGKEKECYYLDSDTDDSTFIVDPGGLLIKTIDEGDTVFKISHTGLTLGLIVCDDDPICRIPFNPIRDLYFKLKTNIRFSTFYRRLMFRPTHAFKILPLNVRDEIARLLLTVDEKYSIKVEIYADKEVAYDKVEVLMDAFRTADFEDVSPIGMGPPPDI